MIITLQNQKGGVGKTTLSLHLAHHLTRSGSRVLVVDADPQGSARDWLEAREGPAPFCGGRTRSADHPSGHRHPLRRL
jgi:chromosome partitioning protein